MATGVGSIVVGELGSNEGFNVEVGVGPNECATGVGAGVVPSEGLEVVRVVGLALSVEGEMVESGRGGSGVGSVVVVGIGVGSAPSGVAVGDNGIGL